MALTVLDKIDIAKISQYLSNVSTAKSGLFGPKPDQQLPEKLYLERKAVEWEYNGEGLTDGTRAAGTIVVTSVGNTGDTYLFTYNYPGIGTVTLGEYETQSSDTTTAILAASIVTELNTNTYGFTFTVTNSTINYLGPLGLGASANGTAISCTYTEYSFVPTDIPDLWAWYDAAVGVTGTTAITAWADQSGNGRNLGLVSAGQEPELVASAVNGLPAVSTYGLSGTRQMTTSVDFADLTAGGTIFLVAAQDSVGSSTDNFGTFLGAGGFVVMQIERGGSASLGFGSLAGAIASSNETTTPADVPEDTFVSIRLKNDVDDNFISFNNGTEYAFPSTQSAYIATPLRLFRTASGAQGNKQIAEILIYSRTLTTNEITDVETYLNSKYALY